MKNHYATLGVLESADAVVIRAVYKALVQRYHPDKFIGDKRNAEENIKTLNEAYEVLSSETKRLAYDKELNGRTDNTEEYFSEEQADAQAEYDPFVVPWTKAEEYYPDLSGIVDGLSKLSWRLAYSYKAQLIESKQFSNRYAVANKMQENFFKLYFGSNPQIIAFAQMLIDKKMKAAAKALNEAVVLFGGTSDVQIIIDRISKKYSVPTAHEEVDSISQFATGIVLSVIGAALLCLLLSFQK